MLKTELSAGEVERHLRRFYAVYPDQRKRIARELHHFQQDYEEGFGRAFKLLYQLASRRLWDLHVNYAWRWPRGADLRDVYVCIDVSNFRHALRRIGHN